MKQKIITLKIDNATHGQLLTLAGELRIMARSWKRVGPDIEVQAGKLRERKLASRGGGWAQSSQAFKLDINMG